jgi:xanthine dehydrogenase accessory factor
LPQGYSQFTFLILIPTMKEIRHIVDSFIQLATSQKVALATVVRVEGSSYRRTGARMLVLDNGTYLGGISGGCLEGDALRRAQKAISSNLSSVVTYDTTRDDDNQIGVGLGCNGIIDVLFTPLQPKSLTNPLHILQKHTNTRQPKLLSTITLHESRPENLGVTQLFENKEKWLHDFAIPEVAEKVLLDVQSCLKKEATQTLFYSLASGEKIRICLEVLLPSTHLVLYGSNNDIYPMSRMAKELGWDLTVVSNPLKAEKSLFSMGAKVLSPKGEELPNIDKYTAIVLMSHDYKTDLRNFQQLLGADARYIGLLGPRKRAQKIFDALAADAINISAEMSERIFAPAGLDIGALSPEEIALSILAEINACFSGRKGSFLRNRAVAIHEEY